MPPARSHIGMVRGAGGAHWFALIVAAAVVEGGLRGAVGPGPRVPARIVSLPLSAAQWLTALRLRGGGAGDAGAPGQARPGRQGRREKKRK